MRYILTLWLLTLSFAPLFLYFYGDIATEELFSEDSVEFILAMLIISIIYSLPSLFVILIIYKLLWNSKVKQAIKKSIILATVVIGIFVTFLLLDGSLMISFILSYVSALLISASILEIFKSIMKDGNYPQQEL